jgi:hypothetical protein
MIVLKSTSETLYITSNAAATTDEMEYFTSSRERTSTTFTALNKFGTSNGTTVETIVDAPSAGSTQVIVDYISIYNKDTVTHTLTVQMFDTANPYMIFKCQLLTGEKLEYCEGKGWQKFNAQGSPIVTNDTVTIGYTGFPFEYNKIGTAAEAIGNWYAFFKDSGFPGAYVLGTPGLNGWWVDASQATNAANPAGAAQVGVPRLVNPSSGSYYINNIGVGSSVAHVLNLIDIIWYNTGAVVTTTTAQAITVPGASKPARDTYGTTNGDGWQIGILVTTATTNAGAITNMTCSYTDSDGNAGNTATIASFPATAVIGTFVPFQLAAGDRGVRSVESLTLGTSLVTGAVSLVIYRTIASVVNPVANVGGIMNKLTTDPTGVRIYNGSALNWIYRASATTATTMNGTINIVER